jgi:4-hydroxybenzoate polyprenyltransferase
VPHAPRPSLTGLIRLVHPFPITLDALATAVVARVAGGSAPTAIRLGLAMLALQASIGALNDLVDAGLDRRGKPGKPIPAGQVSPGAGRWMVVAAAAIGLFLAVPSGAGLVVLGGLGLAIGYAYDLRAKGTAWSWLPFAIGLPLLPLFAWYGAAGTVPGAFVVLVPAAVVAGAGLAIANALADLERDRSSGVTSIATRLGERVAWLAGATALAMVSAVAIVSVRLHGGATSALAVTGAAAILLMLGVVLGRSPSARRRERAWEVQAIGVAVLGVAWLWSLGSAG